MDHYAPVFLLPPFIFIFVVLLLLMSDPKPRKWWNGRRFPASEVEIEVFFDDSHWQVWCGEFLSWWWIWQSYPSSLRSFWFIRTRFRISEGKYCENVRRRKGKDIRPSCMFILVLSLLFFFHWSSDLASTLKVRLPSSSNTRWSFSPLSHCLQYIKRRNITEASAKENRRVHHSISSWEEWFASRLCLW